MLDMDPCMLLCVLYPHHTIWNHLLEGYHSASQVKNNTDSFVLIWTVCGREWMSLSIAPQLIYYTPRTLSQLKKYNFSGERRNHWPGRCIRIKRATTLLPSRSHVTCDAIPLGRYGLRHISCGHNSKWAFFELWHCSSRGAKCCAAFPHLLTQDL
jgi:hypothetical protein